MRPPAALAETPTCNDVLNKCDAALKAKQRELDLADLGVKLRDEQRAMLINENEALRSEGASLWKNPFLWATIGLFIGSRIAR